MTDDDLDETTKTEITTRHFDPDGRMVREVTTVVIERKESQPDLPTGMYL